MSHVDRIRKRDHVLGFLAGASVCVCATITATAAFVDYASKRGIV